LLAISAFSQRLMRSPSIGSSERRPMLSMAAIVFVIVLGTLFVRVLMFVLMTVGMRLMIVTAMLIMHVTFLAMTMVMVFRMQKIRSSETMRSISKRARQHLSSATLSAAPDESAPAD